MGYKRVGDGVKMIVGGGVVAFEKIYDNGMKHILNDDKYCLGFGQWAKQCRAAGFKNGEVSPVKGFA